MYLVLVQTWFFLTPIVYHPAIVPPKFRFALWLNPLYYLVQTFRKPIYDGVLPPPALAVASLGISVAVFVSGWIYFANRAERFAFQNG
jgi:ABC-type polysaccharide/polyol phosphate export permease